MRCAARGNRLFYAFCKHLNKSEAEKKTRANIKVWITIIIIAATTTTIVVFEVSWNFFVINHHSNVRTNNFPLRWSGESSDDMEAIDKSLFRELYRFLKALFVESYNRVLRTDSDDATKRYHFPCFCVLCSLQMYVWTDEHIVYAVHIHTLTYDDDFICVIKTVLCN